MAISLSLGILRLLNEKFHLVLNRPIIKSAKEVDEYWMLAAEQKLAALDADTQLPVLHFLLQVVEKIYYNPTQMKFRAIKTSHEVKKIFFTSHKFHFVEIVRLIPKECSPYVRLSWMLGVFAQLKVSREGFSRHSVCDMFRAINSFSKGTPIPFCFDPPSCF